MKKLIALISAVFLIGALSTPVMATEPAETDDSSGVISALDRHSVWSDFIEERQDQTASGDNQSAMAPREGESFEMKVQIEDQPWQRVG